MRFSTITGCSDELNRVFKNAGKCTLKQTLICYESRFLVCCFHFILNWDELFLKHVKLTLYFFSWQEKDHKPLYTRMGVLYNYRCTWISYKCILYLLLKSRITCIRNVMLCPQRALSPRKWSASGVSWDYVFVSERTWDPPVYWSLLTHIAW